MGKISFIAVLAFLAASVLADKPIISNVANTSITNDSAIITWSTDVSSSSFVNYGTDSQQLTNPVNDAAYTQSHSITLTGLSPAQTYYYNVSSCAQDGNCSSSGTYQFATLPNPSVPAPVISDSSISASATNDSAFISWNTSINSNSIVYYGISSSYGSSNSTNDNVTAHLLFIGGLSPSTSYHYLVSSCNSFNCTNSTDKTFSTSANPSPSPSPTPSPSPGGVLPPAASCYDTDGGRDFFKRGTLLSGNEGGDDVCETATVLREYICNDEKTAGGTIRYECPNGCKEGKCITDAEAAAVNATASAEPKEEGIEKKVGFQTRVLGYFHESNASFTYLQEFAEDFEGRISIVLPLEFRKYNTGLISLKPEPTLAKNDGEGNLQAIWDDYELGEGEEFRLEIKVGEKLDETILEKFSAPELDNRKISAPALETAASSLESNSTNNTVGSLTGLAAAGGGEGDRSWIIAAIQILLLLGGIGAIHYFEKDLHPPENAESILDGLNGKPKNGRNGRQI